MIILLEKDANTIPSPPAGKVAIYADDDGNLAVKKSDGGQGGFSGPFNVTGNSTVDLANVSQIRIGGGLPGYVLTTDGNSNLSWGVGGGGGSAPGGANTQLQFNANGILGGVPNATWNGTDLSLGSVAEIKIAGGSNGQVLTTDGTGNLTWAPAQANVPVIPPVYFQATTSGTGATFTSNTLSLYQSNTDITLFLNGELLLNTQYLLSGNTLTLLASVNPGDRVDVIRQFVANANINVTPGGANSQVQFNYEGEFNGSPEFVWNPVDKSLVAGNVVTANFFVGDGGLLSNVGLSPAGSNGQLQFNNSNVLGASNALTWDNSILQLSAGNAVIANFFVGDGGLLSNIAGGANLSNGTSNIVIGNSSNITFSVAGNINVVDMGGNLVTINRDLSVPANVSIVGTLTLDSENIALGNSAGVNNQSQFGVAIGYNSGSDDQNANAVAIGVAAGTQTQGEDSIAIGSGAGRVFQSTNSVAIGPSAGTNNQGAEAIAVGFQAGGGTLTAGTSQGQGAVAIGSRAGVIRQGQNSIAIGARAGITNQANNSIVLNATGANLSAANANTLVIKPIASTTVASNNILVYNSTTGEVNSMNYGLAPMTVTIVNTPTYVVQPTDQMLAVQFNGNVTITLPTPAEVGSQIFVKDIVGAAGNRRLTPIQVVVGNTSTDRIDANVSFSIAQNWAAYSFTGVTPTQWIIM